VKNWSYALVELIVFLVFVEVFEEFEVPSAWVWAVAVGKQESMRKECRKGRKEREMKEEGK
jgi:hypothetical protein